MCGSVKGIVMTLLLALYGATATAAGLHGQWGTLLASHVAKGKVDYHGFKADEQQLDSYLSLLDRTDPAQLPRDERLAFYLNAYNAYTVKLIVDNFEDGEPVESIKDIGGFFSSPWSIEFVRIGGELMTLDNVEHDIIRPEFKEPRVHFAVNCASISCPPLLDEPYTADRLEQQLQQNTVNFLNDPEFNYIEGETLYVTRIFKWFSEDFPNGPRAFVSRYARGALREGIDRVGDDLRVRYLDYDWNLNRQ